MGGDPAVKISILSAVYNEESHVDEMIDSVLAQSRGDWELIFVSDGSTDATVDRISARMAGDERIRLVGEGNKIGKAAAFNLAFAAACGDVLLLLAGDDTIPTDSLETRTRSFAGNDLRRVRMVTFCKLTTMSEDRRHDGVVLPRGTGSSHSGGAMALSRALAEVVFPIEPSLVSEDLWLSRAAEGLAERIVEIPRSGLNYRIHPGNSNPRMRPFSEMSKALAVRHEAFRLLLECPRFELPTSMRDRLQLLWHAERLRREGQVFQLIALRGLPPIDRAAYAAGANRLLFRIRQRFYRIFSGRRRR
jgi:glycosyltransferase involved in cell wall biosynthesis